MANIIDYLKWRGDITFEQVKLNEVDNLILSQLAFVDFTGIVPADPSAVPITVKQAAMQFFFENDYCEEGRGDNRAYSVHGINNVSGKKRDKEHYKQIAYAVCESCAYRDGRVFFQRASVFFICGKVRYKVCADNKQEREEHHH